MPSLSSSSSSSSTNANYTPSTNGNVESISSEVQHQHQRQRQRQRQQDQQGNQAMGSNERARYFESLLNDDYGYEDGDDLPDFDVDDQSVLVPVSNPGRNGRHDRQEPDFLLSYLLDEEDDEDLLRVDESKSFDLDRSALSAENPANGVTSRDVLSKTENTVPTGTQKKDASVNGGSFPMKPSGACAVPSTKGDHPSSARIQVSQISHVSHPTFQTENNNQFSMENERIPSSSFRSSHSQSHQEDHQEDHHPQLSRPQSNGNASVDERDRFDPLQKQHNHTSEALQDRNQHSRTIDDEVHKVLTQCGSIQEQFFQMVDEESGIVNIVTGPQPTGISAIENDSSSSLLAAQLDRLLQERNEAVADVSRIKKERVEYQAQLQRVMSERDQALQQLEEQQTGGSTDEHSVAIQWEAKCKELERQLRQLKTECNDDLGPKTIELQSQLAQARSEAIQQTTALLKQQHKDDILQLESHLNEATGQVEASKKQLADLLKERESMRTQLIAFQQQNQALDFDRKQARQEATKLQQLLQAQNSSLSSGKEINQQYLHQIQVFNQQLTKERDDAHIQLFHMQRQKQQHLDRISKERDAVVQQVWELQQRNQRITEQSSKSIESYKAKVAALERELQRKGQQGGDASTDETAKTPDSNSAMAALRMELLASKAELSVLSEERSFWKREAMLASEAAGEGSGSPTAVATNGHGRGDDDDAEAVADASSTHHHGSRRHPHAPNSQDDDTTVSACETTTAAASSLNGGTSSNTSSSSRSSSEMMRDTRQDVYGSILQLLKGDDSVDDDAVMEKLGKLSFLLRTKAPSSGGDDNDEYQGSMVLREPSHHDENPEQSKELAVAPTTPTTSSSSSSPMTIQDYQQQHHEMHMLLQHLQAIILQLYAKCDRLENERQETVQEALDIVESSRQANESELTVKRNEMTLQMQTARRMLLIALHRKFLSDASVEGAMKTKCGEAFCRWRRVASEKGIAPRQTSPN